MDCVPPQTLQSERTSLDPSNGCSERRCSQPGCVKQPRFGFPELFASTTRCSPHKLEGMVNLWDKKCSEPACSKFASHGEVPGARRTHCGEHGASLGLVDLKHRICQEGGCTTVATFGVLVDEAPRVRDRRGAKVAAVLAAALAAGAAESDELRLLRMHPELRRHLQPDAEPVPTHCAIHGMPLGLVDVMNPRCQEPGCQASRALPFPFRF